MIPSTLKTIFVDGDLDDSSLLLDVQHPYRDKDLLLANQFDDVEDIVHDQVRQPGKMSSPLMSDFSFSYLSSFRTTPALFAFLSIRMHCNTVVIFDDDEDDECV